MKNPLSKIILLALLGLIISLSACGPANADPQTPGEPGVSASATPVPTEPAKTMPAPTLTSPAPTQPPVATGQQPQAEPAALKALVVLDKAAGEFVGYAMDGSQLFRSPAPGLEYPSAAATEVTANAIYFMIDREKKIFRSTPDGVEALDLPTDQYLSGFAISADERWIAWSTFVGDSSNPHSTLWIASLDELSGKDAKQVITYKPDMTGGNPYASAFNLIAVQWTADGKLLFERSLTGLGGYIPYGGHNSLYSYDPGSGQIATIVPAEENHGLCLSAYRPDLDRAAFHCGKDGAQVWLRNLTDGTEETLPTLPIQGLAGSVEYSPSGAWIAYAVAKGDPENEQGEVVVIPADLSAPPTGIVAVGNNTYPYVLGWADENTILFSTVQWPQMTIWKIDRNGGKAQEFVQGMFIGFAR